MVARKRGRDKADKAAVSPSKPPSKKGRAASPSKTDAASSKQRRIAWRLQQDTVVQPSKLDFNVVDEDDFDDTDTHTAHCDAMLRSAALTESLQHGANAAGLIEEVVAINDVFCSRPCARLARLSP